MRKIAIIGAGRVGESAAQIIAKEELCRELVLLDIHEGIPQGIALDIQESAPLFGFDTRLYGDTEPSAIEDAELVIVTAGLPRKPGMSRSDLLDANVAIIGPIIKNIQRYAPQAIVIIVSNPVDVLTYYAWKTADWDRRRIFGLSGVLDAARMASFIALETGFSVKDISTLVMGGHGDAMVPMLRYSQIAGIPVEHFLSAEKLSSIVDRTRKGGAEILALKQTSSAYDSPAASIATMADAVHRNRRRILPCVAILDGEYAQRNVAMGIPAVLGKDGLEQIIELPLSMEETTQIKASADMVRADLERLGI